MMHDDETVRGLLAELDERPAAWNVMERMAVELEAVGDLTFIGWLELRRAERYPYRGHNRRHPSLTVLWRRDAKEPRDPWPHGSLGKEAFAALDPSEKTRGTAWYPSPSLALLDLARVATILVGQR